MIGEEENGTFKTYYFDARGSTVAITDMTGTICDTFAYDTYGKLISRTGTSKVVFAYNGRDGVVTDDNGLIYMRARYYSPEMKRFINADIVAGAISNAVTLNRFAYANGNPVSFVDPFGLSADNRGSNAEATISCNQAVLVTRFDNEGLKVVGHTQLYFNCDGKWYLAEFTSREGATLKQLKGNARVYWEERTPPVLNDSGQFQDVEGSNYVVLDGVFDESVKLAKQYAGQDPNGDNKEIGRYNFLFHNCSDYTNMLLDYADIDGRVGQIVSEGNGIISIPALREINLSLANEIDEFFGNKDSVLANAIGDRIDKNRSEIGVVVDVVKDVAAGVTNTIVDVGTALCEGGKYLWNKLFG